MPSLVSLGRNRPCLLLVSSRLLRTGAFVHHASGVWGRPEQVWPTPHPCCSAVSRTAPAVAGRFKFIVLVGVVVMGSRREPLAKQVLLGCLPAEVPAVGRGRKEIPQSLSLCPAAGVARSRGQPEQPSKPWGGKLRQSLACFNRSGLTPPSRGRPAASRRPPLTSNVRLQSTPP